MPKKKYKILLAEDDKFLVRTIKDELEEQGFEVALAFDGRETMVKLKKDKPDILLLDLVLPIKDGFEVLEEMKLSDELKYIPVIILSNLAQNNDIKNGLNLGAVDYLVKSDFTINEVAKKVKEHLAKARVKK